MNCDAVRKKAVFLDPRNDFQPRSVPIEVRKDPLTGRTARICHFRALEWERPDLKRRIADSRKTCPFCPERVMTFTPAFPAELLPEERMVSGEMVLFPNLAPYDSVGAVAVMGAPHFIPMGEFESERILNAFRLARDFFLRVERLDHPEAVYHLINWNYMPPSGSTIVHPHLQVFSTSSAPNLMRQELKAAAGYRERTGRNYWEDMVASEMRSERFLGSFGRTTWFSAYAPMGAVGDVLAVVEGVSSTLELSDDDLSDLAKGINAAMRGYDKMGLYSFNMNFFTGTKGDDHSRFHLLFSPRTFYSQALGTPDAGALRILFNETVCMAYPETIGEKLKPEFESRV